MSALRPGIRRAEPHVIEVDSVNAGDLSRARALVGIVESLPTSIGEALCSSIQLPVDLRTDSGELKSIVVHPAWSRKRESLRAAGTPWSQCAESEIRGQCLIDMLDTYATMLGSGALMSGKPPVMRPVVDGAPRMLIGDARWLISGEPWSGSTGLPLGLTRRDTVSMVARLLEGHSDALDPQVRESLNRGVREARNVPQTQKDLMGFFRGLAQELRRCRSEAAKTAALESALRSRSSSVLEREIGEDLVFAERLFGKEVMLALRDQRAVESALEALDGQERRSQERLVRATPRAGSQWFTLDLRPPGEGVVETPEPLDLDRRFVLGDMDWIVRRLTRGELDMANARIATTARAALEERLAASEAPQISIERGRWNSLERRWAYAVEASAIDDRLATHVLVRIEIDGQSSERLERLHSASPQGVRSASFASRLPPGRDVKASVSLVWRRDGLSVAGPNAQFAYATTPNQPSEFASTLNNLRGGDQTDQSPEMKHVVARCRRKALRVVLACVGSAAVTLLAFLLWTEITALVERLSSLLGSSLGEFVVVGVTDETGG